MPCRIRVSCPSAHRAHTGASSAHTALVCPSPHCPAPGGRRRPRCSGLPEPCLPPRPCAAAMFRAGPPNAPLSLSEGFNWDGEAIFPGTSPDDMYLQMQIPVTKDNIQIFTSLLVKNALARATWFRTPHVLWPWVSWGPWPWFLNSVQVLLSSV